MFSSGAWHRHPSIRLSPCLNYDLPRPTKLFNIEQTRTSPISRILAWIIAKNLGSGEKAMSTPNAEKCAHPVCSCMTTSGKYCSVECKAMEKTPDVECSCVHAGCNGKTS